MPVEQSTTRDMWNYASHKDLHGSSAFSESVFTPRSARAPAMRQEITAEKKTPDLMDLGNSENGQEEDREDETILPDSETWFEPESPTSKLLMSYQALGFAITEVLTSCDVCSRQQDAETFKSNSIGVHQDLAKLRKLSKRIQTTLF